MKECDFLWIKFISRLITERFCFVNYDVAFWIACQAALESNYGKSTVAINNYNIFGMKFPKKRLSTAIGEKHNHAVFPSVTSCIVDYFFYLQYNGYDRRYFKELSLFLTRFPKSYCPVNDYIDRVNSIYNQFNSFKKC